MGLETLAVASLISAGASAINTGIQYNQGKKALKESKRQYNETKAEAERTKQIEQNKQQELTNTYKNMKANLYSGDINGISSNQLIQ